MSAQPMCKYLCQSPAYQSSQVSQQSLHHSQVQAQVSPGFHNHCHRLKQAHILAKHHLNQASQHQYYQSLYQLVLLPVASLQRILLYHTGQHHSHHLNPAYSLSSTPRSQISENPSISHWPTSHPSKSPVCHGVRHHCNCLSPAPICRTRHVIYANISTKVQHINPAKHHNKAFITAKCKPKCFRHHLKQAQILAKHHLNQASQHQCYQRSSINYYFSQ